MPPDVLNIEGYYGKRYQITLCSDNSSIHSASWSSRNRKLLPSFSDGSAGRRRLVAWSRTQDGETFSHSETCRTVSNCERMFFGSFGSESCRRRPVPSIQH